MAIYFDHPGTLTVCEFQVFGGKFLSVYSLEILWIVISCNYLFATFNKIKD